jgi:hypothetical protein
MPPKFKYQELVDTPLGPFADDEILSASFPPPEVLPTLEMLTLECAEEATGFDECEYIMPPSSDSLISKHTVFFYGVLKVDSLEWLSEGGRDLLEANVRKRDEELHPHIGTSRLRLERLYDNAKRRGLAISVFIRCEKNLAAEYMTCA